MVEHKPIDLSKIERDRLLSTFGLAACLRAAGYDVTGHDLVRMAAGPGGPPYTVSGEVRSYRWGDALEWAVGLRKAA